MRRNTDTQSPGTQTSPPDTPPTSLTPSSATMTSREKIEAISGIVVGMFVAILAMTIVSTSLPRIVAELGGTQQMYTWIATATMLTSAISTPLWGKFADLTNKKRLIQAALLVTVLSAAAAGFAPNSEFLIACRAFQGIGAGGLMALATVLIADITSPRERGKYMGIIGGIMAVAQVGGPLAGGLITDAFGWRWNFFMAVPFAVIAMILLQRTLKLPVRPRKDIKVDYWGAATLSAGVALLLLWVTFAGDQFAWSSWQSWTMAISAVVLLAACALIESKVSEPIIPLHLFNNRTFILGLFASMAVGMGMFGSAIYLSQYLQLARGLTPTEAGLMTIPMVIGTFTGSIVSGRIISRTGKYKTILIVGAILLPLGLFLLSRLELGTSFVILGLDLVILGLGVGMLMQNLVLVVQNTLDIHETGAGTSSLAFFRSLGGTLGVSVMGAVLAQTVKTDLAEGFAKLGIPAGAGGDSGAVPDLSQVPAPVKAVIEGAYSDGITEVFLICVPIALIALVLVSFVKALPLGTRTGLEEAASDKN